MASLYAQNAIARIKVEQAQAALAAAEANLEAAKAHQTRLPAKASPEATNSKSKQHSRHNSIINAAAKTAGQRSPEPLYRHSDGKTAKQRRYSCSGTTYPDYPRNRTMPGKSENAAAAGRSFKNRSGSNCRGRCTQKNFPRYYHSH